MDTEFVSVGQQLQQELGTKFADSIKVTSTLDASMQPVADTQKTSVPAPSMNAAESAPEAAQAAQASAPRQEPSIEDKRLAKVIAEAQKVRAERQAFQQDQSRHKQDMEELAQYRNMKALAKEDPVAWAEFGGYKPDEYATTLMEKGSMSPERRKIIEQQRELNEIKSWKNNFEQQQQEAQLQNQYQSVVSEMSQFGRGDDTYDLVHRTKSYDLVLAKINQHYQATAAVGEAEILPYETAFSIIEQELENKYAPMIESPKLRSRLSQAPADSAAPLAQPAARKTAGINNKMRAQSAAPQPLSQAERFQKAGEVLLSQIYGRRG